jgi:C_GCAxxG_C_C family probable redox protein
MQKDRIEQAVQTCRSGYNCSQSVFSAYCDIFYIDESKAKLIAAGFGGGLGSLQKTCGAVTGAIMLIGLRFFDEQDRANARRETYARVREFVAQFEERNRTVSCLDLLGVDLSTEEGRQKARDEKLFELRCEPLVREACEIVEKFIL